MHARPLNVNSDMYKDFGALELQLNTEVLRNGLVLEAHCARRRSKLNNGTRQLRYVIARLPRHARKLLTSIGCLLLVCSLEKRYL